MITAAVWSVRKPAHRSRPMFQSAVVGLDPVVGVLFGVVPGCRHQLVDGPR